MNRIEALNILGLDDDATDRDIKVAYKECVQILHPDRFAGNAKLQDRATEQFKRLQDAYDYLSSGRGSKSSSGSSRSRSAPPPHFAEAKLAGLAAARTQLIAQRDALYDERRNALIMMAAGAVGAVLLRRIVWIAAIFGTLVIWGIVSFISTHQNISTINEHLKEIELQKRSIEEEWEEE